MGVTGSKAGSMASTGADHFTPETRVSFVLDASSKGCTGMFWRTSPSMSASSTAADWPRNGAQLQGWVSKEHPGWVRVDHPSGFWLPIEQSGHTVVHLPK
mmetsp:Transcript_30101/g.89289  ORF Transcript_30101/g.89289 Transcript_30101/m.89289 type:complete len:100 (-) Transcript_30101:213-512(-)